MHSFSPVFRRGRFHSGSKVAIWTAIPDHLDSTRNTWDYLNRRGRCPHFLWNPKTGDLIEGVKPEYSGTFFPGYGYAVAVMCDPEDPFTHYPLEGSESLCKALEGLGVPEVWPKGPPGLYVAYSALQRPLRPGHYSANQINPDWTGVGAIDIGRLHGANA